MVCQPSGHMCLGTMCCLARPSPACAGVLGLPCGGMLATGGGDHCTAGWPGALAGDGWDLITHIAGLWSIVQWRARMMHYTGMGGRHTAPTELSPGNQYPCNTDVIAQAASYARETNQRFQLLTGSHVRSYQHDLLFYWIITPESPTTTISCPCTCVYAGTGVPDFCRYIRYRTISGGSKSLGQLENHLITCLLPAPSSYTFPVPPHGGGPAPPHGRLGRRVGKSHPRIFSRGWTVPQHQRTVYGFQPPGCRAGAGQGRYIRTPTSPMARSTLPPGGLRPW